MNIPKLRKEPRTKSCHTYTWEDNYSWIHQDNCLEILRDKNKLNPEVKKYLEEIIILKRIWRTQSLSKKIYLKR